MCLKLNVFNINICHLMMNLTYSIYANLNMFGCLSLHVTKLVPLIINIRYENCLLKKLKSMGKKYITDIKYKKAFIIYFLHINKDIFF